VQNIRNATAALAAPPTTMGTAAGFDRLINSGMTADEVAAIRTSFRPEVDVHAARRPQEEGENRDVYRFRVEDEWIARQGPAR